MRNRIASCLAIGAIMLMSQISFAQVRTNIGNPCTACKNHQMTCCSLNGAQCNVQSCGYTLAPTPEDGQVMEVIERVNVIGTKEQIAISKADVWFTTLMKEKKLDSPSDEVYVTIIRSGAETVTADPVGQRE